MPYTFTTLAANAAAMNAEAEREIEFINELECEAKSERRDFVNDIEGTDRHATGCSHDRNGLRIL